MTHLGRALLTPLAVERLVAAASVYSNLELDLAAAGPHCAIASYANEGGDPQLEVRKLMFPNIVLRFVLVYTIPEAALRAAVEGVSRALEVGALTTLPLHRFPLERTADAHDAVRGEAVGKVLIDLADLES